MTHSILRSALVLALTLLPITTTYSQTADEPSRISQLLKQLRSSQERERRQRELAEIRLHALQLRRASDFWNANQVLTARNILGQTKKEIRGFEYGYLHAIFHPSQRELALEGKFSVGGYAVAVSQDGKRIVTCGVDVDRIVRVWDGETCKMLSELKGHHGFLRCVAITRDGKTIATGDIRHQMKLWDAETYQLKRTIDAHDDDVLAVAFSPNGDRLLTGGDDRKVKVWDTQTGEELLVFDEHTAEVNSLAFSPNGKTVASAAGDVHLWDAETGNVNVKIRAVASRCVAFSPDGTQVAIGKGVYDAGTGEQKARFSSLRSQANGISFSPDGKKVAIACEDHNVHICDAITGESIETLKGHSHEVHDVAFVDTDRVVSGGRFSSRVFELGSKRRPLKLRSTTPAAFSPDSKLIATSTRRSAELRDLASGDLVASYDQPGGITALTFSPDNSLLVTAGNDKTIKLWDLAKGEARASLECPDHAATRLLFSPDGLQMASWHRQSLIVWTIAPTAQKNYEIRSGLAEQSTNRAFAFSPDGSRMVVVQDKKIKILNAYTGGFSHLLNENQSPTTLQFSPDGEHVLGGYFYPWGPGDYARVWDAKSGQQTIALHGTSASYGPKPKWSTDGRWFLTRNQDPRAVNVWDAQSGQRVSNMHPNTLMNDAVFFPDGKRIASVGNETVTIFDTLTGEQLITLLDSGGNYLATTADGNYLSAIDYNGSASYTLTIWDGTAPGNQ